MNSEAASETQYEDSKSQLSTYRKDDKIMLKRKLLSLLLALVLVVGMAIPAFANPIYGYWEGFNYTLSLYFNTSTSRVTMSVDNTVQVTAKGRAYIYALALGQRMWGYWYSATNPNSSLTATVYVNNYVYDANGTLYTGTIEKVEGQGKIGDTVVRTITS